VKFRNAKNRERTDEEKAARVKGLLEKEKEKRIRLKELGIDYEFSGYVSDARDITCNIERNH
jgi:hypothetical protein